MTAPSPYRPLLLGVCLLAFPSASVAQSLQANSSSPTSHGAKPGRRVSLTRSVEPSFNVEPVVHRFRARRGEVIPFVFEITSTGKTMKLDVKPVNLRQEETGIILHDQHSEPMGGVTLTSPTQFELMAGQKFRIEGTVKVPLVKSNYVSFGLLVRDRGIVTDVNNELEEGQTRAAVKFVTQYVLRVDIETGSQKIGNVDSMHFDGGQLIDREGMPYVRAYLENPTDYALECGVRAELIDADGDGVGDPARLYMPSRSALDDDKRFLVRIMPHSRLRLETPLSAAMVDGDYTLRLRLSNGRRTMIIADYPTTVNRHQFGALAVHSLMLPGQVSVIPAQLELGRIAETERMATVEITNLGSETQTVRLDGRDHQGNVLTTMKLSSEEFSLKPGRSKTIRAMLRGNADFESQWGQVAIAIDGNQAQAMPLSLLHAGRPETDVKATELQWLAPGAEPHVPHGAFVMTVRNHGNGYSPIHGSLKLAAEQGRPLALADGFGKWLAPGNARELVFALPPGTRAGRYQVRLRVGSRADADVADQTLVIDLTDQMLGLAGS
ncbi:MAG: hypothetical protein AAGD07_09160 [Planctomycetota bacterium]